MSPLNTPTFLFLGLALAGCNSMTTSEMASVACLGAETTSTVAAIVASDASAASNGASATHAARVTSAVQKTVSDVCPIITAAAAAMTALSPAASSK